ncbi:hypothetical protein T552_02238 [Pneumocystis carinii B80]|uniref:Ribosomal protein mS38 C-terminal domain-containing protein n=1 Tax=Pneumocystis carinii (strain B80) TaxID=1408658 RepID=A0A0W4ZHE9_PNEC8|nr:hypothetical protein T552_02238 [Pneumocystis carinii B80]KTW27799.1 hypothetical protein T552_02238 [Pneumocystis carinii B80]
MRHNILHNLFRHSQTRLRLPWSSCSVAVSPHDLAISLIWSQHRPLALFHQNQKIQTNELLVVPEIATKPSKTSFVWPERIRHTLNLLKTNSSNELLFESALWPFQPFCLEKKAISYPTLYTPFFSPILYDFYEERQATSVKRKRRLKMNKHKFRKRRDRQRALRKRLGK